MCLAIPGLVKKINNKLGVDRSALVLFGGIEREINLSCVAGVKEGDYIIAHAGVALQVLDEEEAQNLLSELESLSNS